MRVSKVVIGEYYRHASNPNIGYAKALKVLKPKEGDNTHTYSIVKCEWTRYKNETMGFIKHFKATDLVKEPK
jgi:hypothetical protein